MDALTRYVLFVIVALLFVVVVFLARKYRKLVTGKEVKLGRDEVIGRLFLRKLNKLKEGIGKGDTSDLFRELHGVMRGFFSELFDMKYEFAYVELNEELSKRGVSENVRKNVVAYSMQMSETLYGGHKMMDQDLHTMAERSILIVRDLTGYAPKPGEAEAIEEAAGAPAKEAKKGAGAREEMKAPEQDLEKRILLPKTTEDNIMKLRKLLLEAEQHMEGRRLDKLMASYSEIRDLYDSLPPDVKRGIYTETRRIIEVYNFLLKNYKEFMGTK